MRALLAGARRKQPALLRLAQKLVRLSRLRIESRRGRLRRAGCGACQDFGREGETTPPARVWRRAGGAIRTKIPSRFREAQFFCSAIWIRFGRWER